MPGRQYAGYSNATNTVSATVPMFNLTGASTTRVTIEDFLSGSDATPADAATKLAFQRSSAAGTTSSTTTPNALDPANPASLTTYATAWSVNPTITASSTVLQIAQNQRATARWVAAPYYGLTIPATAGAGLALISVVASATANYAWTTLWTE